MTKDIELTGMRLAYANLVASVWQADVNAATRQANAARDDLMKAVVQDMVNAGEVPANGGKWSFQKQPSGALVLTVEVPDISPAVDAPQQDASAG